MKKNHSNGGEYVVFRGAKNVRDVGRIVTFNGESEQDVWSDEGNCNEIKGTDGTIFPPFLARDEGMWAYAPDLCRSLAPKYEGKSSYAGMPMSRYVLDLGDIGVSVTVQ